MTKRVTHFRQILLWPVQIVPAEETLTFQDSFELLSTPGPDNPWREVADEFTGDPADFQERHYNEFVTFLPAVQRFLYGQGLGKSVRAGFGESPIKVLRRSDVAKLRVQLSPSETPIEFDIAHIDLYLFFDIDVAILVVEIHNGALSLETAQEAIYQLGHAYPAFWQDDGRAGHCPVSAEWLSATGESLAKSDYDNRQRFLAFVNMHRAPAVAAHWDFIMRPLVLDHRDRTGPLRYRQLEYYRMPVMAYLALENPAELTRADYVRLALTSASGDSAHLPTAACYFDDFEKRYCYDRNFEDRSGADWSNTRYMSAGYSFVVTGSASNAFFTNLDRGYLSKFRHQHFLLFLIAHFHKAALLMFSDRLAAAVNKLDIRDQKAARRFRREIRETLEQFLRFVHRYWFQSVSDHTQEQELFELCRRHLGIDALYEEVRQEVHDMSQFLENEAQRRQNESMVRLTVVTAFGLIGTVATGFLGMNLFDMTHLTGLGKAWMFMAVALPSAALTFYAVQKSRRLSEFMDTLADEAASAKQKWSAFVNIWGSGAEE